MQAIVSYHFCAEYLGRVLLERKSNRETWFLSLNHTLWLPQTAGRLQINGSTEISRSRLTRNGFEPTKENLAKCDKEILLIRGGKMIFSTTFQTELVKSCNPKFVLVLDGEKINPSTNVSICKNLFGKKYDYKEAWNLIDSMRKDGIEFENLTKWRTENHRPPIPVSKDSVISEIAKSTETIVDYAKLPIKE